MLLKLVCAFAACVLFLALPPAATAHAILIKSTPAAGTTVAREPLPIAITFNSKIDAGRSKIILIGPGETKRTLVIKNGDAPNTLRADAGDLEPGKYYLQWQVLAVDGHITRGQIPFNVK